MAGGAVSLQDRADVSPVFDVFDLSGRAQSGFVVPIPALSRLVIDLGSEECRALGQIKDLVVGLRSGGKLK